MRKEEARERIIQIGVVPVIRASSGREAFAACEAVCAGGISVIEITMTVPGAIEVIGELHRTIGKNILVGAGTVLDPATARMCLDAGAQFLVSPGFNPRIIELARRDEKSVMAGALTPTEVIAAWEAGADFVKIFPCGAVGGPAYIRSLRGPFPELRLVPTGGVSLSTAAEYIRAGAMALGVGSELVSAAALKSGETSSITALARQYVAAVHEARAEGETALTKSLSAFEDGTYERH